MPKLWVKDNGAWKQVQRLWTKKYGTWTSVITGSINQSGIGKQFYPDAVPATTYTTPGTYTYTIPAGVTSIIVSIVGGGGGGGGIDGGNASQGRGGKIITFTRSVTPGEVYRIGVGGGGGGGTNLATPAPGGSGGTTASYSGIPDFTGGTGGTGYSSGGGAGGGAASWFATSGASLIAVSGGGAGGGGSGRFSGPPGYSTGYNSTSIGANGQNYSGDMGGGGGGGGGYTYGGAGGTTPGGDNGAYGGNDGQSLVPSGATTSTATNYGTTGVAGTAGYVSITPLNANVISYNSPGTYTFTVPAGVTSLNTTVIGGGGGSAGNYQTTSGATNGNSGSGGVSLTGSLPVTPGATYTIVVGSGGTFGAGNLYGGGAGSGASGYANGSNGITNTGGGGGGGGGSSAILLSGTALVHAKGGGGGTQSSGGAGGSGGGSNVIPSGFTTGTGSNGGAGGNLRLIYSGSYSNGQGTPAIQPIYDALVSTYPYLYSSIDVPRAASGNDGYFPMTLSRGTNLVAKGYQIYPAYIDSSYTTLNSGAFSYGRTVSGINFATGNTQSNGGQTFAFYYGDTWNSGTSGQVTISYGYIS